jgi:hypothetical protein
VVGSIILRTSVILVAGNPLRRWGASPIDRAFTVESAYGDPARLGEFFHGESESATPAREPRRGACPDARAEEKPRRSGAKFGRNAPCGASPNYVSRERRNTGGGTPRRVRRMAPGR